MGSNGAGYWGRNATGRNTCKNKGRGQDASNQSKSPKDVRRLGFKEEKAATRWSIQFVTCLPFCGGVCLRDLGFPRCRCLGAFGLVFAFAFSDVAYVAGESFGIGNGVNVDVAVALEVEVGMGIRSWLRIYWPGGWAIKVRECYHRYRKFVCGQLAEWAGTVGWDWVRLVFGGIRQDGNEDEQRMLCGLPVESFAEGWPKSV
uniref:HDC07362 n=1 Tax=Drosophila melanogaster TaxID=7227 RepID=Q6IG38_DROME|nr:TPA_inf: HDC07362 [Drosophila melanogaster]